MSGPHLLSVEFLTLLGTHPAEAACKAKGYFRYNSKISLTVVYRSITPQRPIPSQDTTYECFLFVSHALLRC